jgi:hypothetical protein
LGICTVEHELGGNVKLYKRLMRFIQIAVILVVLPRVASFVTELSPHSPGLDIHDIIAWAFAATLGLGVISTAYFSDESPPPRYDEDPTTPKERKRREREAAYYTTMLQAAPYSRRALYVFAFLDGSFNLADALMGATANGLFDAESTILVGVYIVATVLFGIAPTFLAIVLARVISMVDRIPEDYERPVTKREMDLMRTIMGNLGLKEYKSGDAAALLSSSAERTPTEPGNEQVRGSAVRSRTNLQNNGSTEVRDRIVDFVERVYADEARIPGPTEISEATGATKSYAHETRKRWQEVRA